MAPIPSLEVLRTWLARDQAALNTMLERLKEIEALNTEDMQAATRNSLSTWDRTVITECSKHLDVMEQIESPSKEERSIMSELHKLVFLGDHMIERINLLQATVRDKTLRSKKGRQELPRAKTTPAVPKEIEEELMPEMKRTKSSSDAMTTPEHQSAVQEVKTSPRAPSPLVKVVGEAVFTPTPQLADNKLIYDLLGVSPNASTADIKKSIRKQTMQRHPDRLPGDLNASAKFADFKILCAVFDKDESRAEYDQTGEVEDVDDLSGLVAKLRLA